MSGGYSRRLLEKTSSAVFHALLLAHRQQKLWVPHGPDFLWRLVALIDFMRLSLMKGAPRGSL
jgi:hypothetical protein